MASTGPRTIHPRDKALLKPLSALGKPASAMEQVSFLRRTEYAASSNPQMFATGSSKDLLRLKNDPKRKESTKSRDKEDPLNILKNIVKGFDIAYPQDAHKGEDTAERIRGAAVTPEEIKAWANPQYPDKNKNVTLLDSYPILPDLEAIPQMGSYMLMKFTTNPIPMPDRYDTRLDTAIFRPCVDPEKEAIYEQKKEEWAPESGKPKPLQFFFF